MARVLPQAALASRRLFLRRAALAGATAFLHPRAAHAAARPRFDAYPFALGVASGSPRPEGMVLWTRLAPKPLEGGGMDPQALEVRWEVASDAAFGRVLRRGTATAHPANAHAVHVEVDGLAPGREYFYRFVCGAEASGAGRTRTAPEPGRGDDRMRFAFASCQQYEQGYFVAHRHLAEEDADLVVFLGDYIYEASWGRDHVRKHGAPEPVTLEEYRNRYGLYKLDRDLQKSHAAAPWIVTWDDHEVENDYADDRSQKLDPAFLMRRAAAYKAFLEHMPLRRSVLRDGGGIRLYDRHAWGSLAQFHVLDDRQYRSHQVCPKPGRGGANVIGDDCATRLDPSRTMLGAAQERWLDDGLGQSRALWNVIAQQTLFAPATRQGEKGPLYWTDGWDGYPAARQRLLTSIAQRRASNPLVISGDVHACYAANLHAHPGRPDSPIIATEFCGTSITSQGPSERAVAAILETNAHIRYGNGSVRGYSVIELRRDRLDGRLRAVQTVKHPDSPITTVAQVTMPEGKPGLPA
jgi:alkaline phosphatase D